MHILGSLSFFLIFLLKCGGFTIFQVYHKVIQFYVIYVYSFSDSFPYRLSQGIEYSSLCYTVDPCWLSILYIVVFIRRRQWHPTPVLLPGKSHGQRNLVGCCLWGHTELDMTEAT